VNGLGNQNKRDEEKLLRRQKRCEEILDSAEILFSEKGIKESKMTDIAKQCELSKGSLYFYFKSKDEIVWELLRKYSLIEYSAGQEYIEKFDLNAYEKLGKYIRLFSDELIQTYRTSNLSYQYREYMMNMIKEDVLSDVMKDQFKEVFERNVSTFSDLIKAGQSDGSIKKDINADVIGRGMSSAFGTHFRYLVGLKSSFDEDFVKLRIEEFVAFNMMILESLKGA